MDQKKWNGSSNKWKHRVYKVCLLGMMCFMLAGLLIATGQAPAAYASEPGGNVADPVVRAVDIAKPAVVRIFSQLVGQLAVNINGKTVTFPLTPQDGFNGYPIVFTGSGAFISARGDILTADHVINPVQDDKTDVDQALDQTAAPDVATYINQHTNQQVTADQVTQELVAGQLQSTSTYQKPLLRVFRSTDYSGPLTAASLQQVPATDFADVDQIKASSPFSQFDTAIIHVSGMDNMPMLQLGDSSAVQTLDSLTIIGFPGNGDVNNSPNDILTSSINVITVSSIKTTSGGAPLIQVGGNVEHGDSGGPALDSNGQVVGIVSFGVGTSGSTSFLRASSSAKQMMQQAGIDATPSAFQKAWSQAFTDYASSVPGHWHQSTREFQQLAAQYPEFKAVSPFLQYASQQAQTEKQTQEAGTPVVGTPTAGTSPSSSTSILGTKNTYLIIGGLLVLVIVVFGGSIAIARSRRRKPAFNGAASVPPGYGAPPSAGSYPGGPGQSYGALPAAGPGPGLPQTPFGQQPRTPAYPGQVGYQPTQPQMQPPASAPQPPYRPQPPAQPVAGHGMAAFGAPAAPGQVPQTPQPSDSTIVVRSGTSSGQQWRIWPCGHTNRYDASFCGTCGESAPPAPIVRRVEQ
jgi:S1-C subfamily serine protease